MSIKKNEQKLQSFVEAEEKNLTGVSVEDNTISSNTLSIPNEFGWIRLDVANFPSRGMFYTEGTEISIKAATGGEIRHWSTMNESDISGMDDILNYVLERCVAVKIPGIKSNWKDIIEIDRLYIILAIRELTFRSENPLRVDIGSGKSRPVSKDMIKYADFGEKLMKYYDSNYKCFVFKLKSGKTHYVTLPTVGITSWFKQYIIKNQQSGKQIEMDFLNYAPFIIGEWRDLSEKAYGELLTESQGWDTMEISLLSKVRDMLFSAINPELIYLDEHGLEVHAPLEFLGGIKSIFIIQDIFDELL